jgi:transposase InsO family protein
VPKKKLVDWIGIAPSKFYDWQRRYGEVNEHNGWMPRGHWLQDWEREAILDFWRARPEEGYRRLCYMMLDQDVVAVSASSVYRVLKQAGAFRRWKHLRGSSKKGTGFTQPTGPHRHWHVDISYVKLRGVFYYLISVLDGYSRSIVAWDIRESMTTGDVQIVLQKAHEAYPEATPRVISDNGSQFVARDFKEYIGQKNFDHVTTAPAYPESNGKKERFFRTIKEECLRPKTPLDLNDARRLVASYITEYNEHRLHSAIGYITPSDKLEGREDEIFAARDAKIEDARRRRADARQQQRVKRATQAAR